MRALREENGTIVVLTALSLVGLLGFLGLATDVGMLYFTRRNAQTAADSAAVEAAREANWATYDGTTVTDAAGSASARNGFTNGSSGVTVTVSNPPATGPHSGNAKYVEVTVQQDVPTYFMKVLGRSSVPVSARAVAGTGGANAGCIYTLGTSGTDISLSGSAIISAPNCVVYDNSVSSKALSMSGSSALTTASNMIVGGYSNSSSGALSPAPVTGANAVGDPLAYLPEPTIPGSCAPDPKFSGGTHALTKGCYQGITGSGGATIAMGSGLYIIHGNFTLSGGSGASGSDVTFYVTGTTNLSGGSNLNLSAPTSGTYNGILYFQARNDTNTATISGSSTSSIKGILYAASAPLVSSGSSGETIEADYVVKTLTLSGSATLGDYDALSSQSPLQSIALVE